MSSFIQDRSLHLMDGTRLLNQHQYEAAKTAANLCDAEMSQRYENFHEVFLIAF